MSFWVDLITAGVLLIVGIRLSAFFSGSETGFYRVSFLRLSIDAHAGDKVASRLMWFVQHPEYFVATTLVGNNIANYLVTLAIGLGAGIIFHSSDAVVDVAMTLMFAPVIFVLGELMPKNLYFRAPTLLLRRGVHRFRWCYRLFLPVSWPLVGMTRLFERLSGARPHQLELVLGRHRLNHVLNQGHEHGILTAEQGHLIHGLLHDASRPASEVMVPQSRIRGVVENTSRRAMLDFAQEFGLTIIPVRRHESKSAWFGYVSVLELELSESSSRSLIRPLPLIVPDASRLSALLTLRDGNHAAGLLSDGVTILGLVTERLLIERFMHPAGARLAQVATE